MEIRILGPLEAEDEGRPLSPGGPGERKVLALLAVFANGVLSTDRLISELWGDEPPQTARNIVQRYVSNLRRGLGRLGERIETRPPGYLLRLAEDELDAARFQQLFSNAQGTKNPREAALHLGTALALWRGRPLDDIEPSPSIEAEAARLVELHLTAVEARIDVDLALGKDAVLVGELEGLVHLHPLRERFRGQLMLALYRAGRQSEALRVYQDARLRLGEELGIEPSDELTELEDRMLRHDPGLLLPASLRRAAPSVLPTGAVTFLLTDIEGSTALWDTDPAWMAEAQSTAHRLIAAAVELHHGAVFKELGDGLCAAFESAPAALEAAQQAQRALTEEDWKDGGPLRVRMAVHTGTAFPSGNDYVGPPLNRCARLLDAGHGGQILVSSTTAGLSGAELGEASQLLALGSFELPGLSDPEEIYQLAHPTLPGEFPPLRAQTSLRTNLPVFSSSFVGRTDALATARTLLEQNRLVSLIGPGGAGKTRLAVEIGSRLLDHYTDGVWLVELAPIVDPELVVAAVAESLGVTRRPTEALGPAVLDHLRTQSVLVILDNCEHVIETAATFADTALRAAPGLTVLATSREGLGVDGEQRWPVPPLDLPAADTAVERLLENEAIRLFADRSAHARPGFVVDAANAETVARICRDLDGIPLAIELGAARLKTLSLEELAARLADRFDLLTAGSRTALPRHQTLQAVVDWSFELLEEAERSLFRTLSVFAGGFTLEAAEAVAEPDLNVLDLLDRLVDKSLVIADLDQPNPRYRLLETLRRYGEKALADVDGLDPMAARHAAFFLELAEEARRELRHDPTWYARLDGEHDNLRKALGWALRSTETAATAARMAVSLREFWQVRGHWREAQRWLDLCLAQGDEFDPALHGQLDHAAGVISALRRDYARALPHLEAALEAFRLVGGSGDIADALLDLAQAAARHGDYARAETLLAECRPLYEKEGNETGAAEAGCVLAQVAVFRGDQATAALEGAGARDHFEQLGDQYGVAWVQSVLGELAYSSNDLDEADRLFREATTLAEGIDVPQFVANGLQGMGDIAGARGNCREADRLLKESLRINREIGDTLFVAGVIASLAETQARCGNHAQAARLWGLDQHLRDELGSMPSRRRGGRYDLDHEELQRLARENLGSARFEESLAEGANLTLDEILADLASIR